MDEVDQETLLTMHRLGYTYCGPDGDFDGRFVNTSTIGAQRAASLRVFKHLGNEKWTVRATLAGRHVVAMQAFDCPITAVIWLNVELAGE